MLKQSANSSFTLRWSAQAGLGILLVVLLAVHLIVNHWVAPHGLLTYADIIRYYDNLGVVWMESIFLIAVVLHCALGLHSILLDLNIRLDVTRMITWVLALVGLMAIIYGLWLIRTVDLLAV